MRNRLWYELAQAKYNERYVCLLIGYQRSMLNGFNLIITVFSTAGIMGWKLWNTLPIISCAIIATISLLKLVQPHLIPSDKQIEKLDKIADFYFNFYLQLEKIWFDFENERITEFEMQSSFHTLKQNEREINRVVNEVHKKPNKRFSLISRNECNLFFERAFNTSII